MGNDIGANIDNAALKQQHAAEVAQGQRFEFGKNWSQFLTLLNDARIVEAEKSLRAMLGVETLQGKSFVDIGSGSGLFSLAARRLGARVFSLDYDTNSVACTAELKRRYFPDDADWTVTQGSALDPAFLNSLGQFDVVYSWGVLHHTGQMWDALTNVVPLVAPGGKLFISIYNDQGGASRRWTKVKQAYCKLPGPLKGLVLYPAALRLWGPATLRDLLKGRPFHTWRTYIASRGMSPWRDVVDWVGGYPFEVARPEEIFEFYHKRGFDLIKMKTCGGGHGCNEYVFDRTVNSAR